MENQKIRTLDDQGRAVLPRKLTSQVGWEAGQRLTAIVNFRHKTIELFSNENGNLQMDELGVLTLPKGFTATLGWGYRDKLLVEVNVSEGSMLLELDTKYVPKCVFCGKEEEALSINGMSICEEDMLAIASHAYPNKLR